MGKNRYEEEFSLVIDPETVPGHHLVLFNDEVNTFDFVIDSLIEVCSHERIQAVQCTYLVHFKGKCSVKDGEFKELRPLCEALLDRGLTASIE